MEIMVQTDYFQSYQLKEATTNNIYNLAKILNYYKSEDYILAGHTTYSNEEELPWDLRVAYEIFESDYRNNYPDVEDNIVFKAFTEEEELDYESYRVEKINSDLTIYKEILNQLEKNGVYYSIETEGVLKTNVPEYTKSDFLNAKVFFTFDENDITTSFNEFNPFFHGVYALEHFPQDRVYMTYDKAILDNNEKVWTFEQGIYKPSISILFYMFMLLIVTLIYIAYDFKSDNFPWIKNNWYFDVRVFLFLMLIVILQSVGVQYYDLFGLYYTIPASLISALIIVNMYLSLIKHYYDRNFFRSNLSIVIVASIFKFIGLIFTKFPTMLRMLPTPYKAKDLNNIINGVKNIKDGDVDHVITSKSKGLYRTLASDINSITDGLKAAVYNELKSDRMRTELISNVSHDIRTPLTSIITYVDLIKRTDDPEKKEEYLKIIDQKSQRLKNLTDDLFEASKVSSGSISVQLEAIDIQFLLSQCLGELSEKMEESNLEFVINYHHTHKYVYVDGNLMFRIVENLMSNIFKYSLKNSRVYINIEEEEDCLTLVFKNISAYPLDVDPNELFDRFKRGDDSRSTEGSGLGLSITEKLVELQNGKTHLHIDGDLFKASISLKKAELENINN